MGNKSYGNNLFEQIKEWKDTSEFDDSIFNKFELKQKQK